MDPYGVLTSRAPGRRCGLYGSVESLDEERVVSGEGRVLDAGFRFDAGCSHADVIDVRRIRPAVADRSRRGVGDVISQVVMSEGIISKASASNSV